MPIRQNQADLNWMRDLLASLTASHEKLQWQRDPCSIHYMTQAMLREIDVCRRLCMSLHKHATLQTVN